MSSRIDCARIQPQHVEATFQSSNVAGFLLLLYDGVEVSVIFFYCVVHLSNKSCLSCRPCGKVMSSRPDSTPIILLCSSVTPTMRATCEAKQSEMHGHSLSLSLGLIIHMDWFKKRDWVNCVLLVHYPLNPKGYSSEYSRLTNQILTAELWSTPINCANNN